VSSLKRSNDDVSTAELINKRLY